MCRGRDIDRNNTLLGSFCVGAAVIVIVVAVVGGDSGGGSGGSGGSRCSRNRNTIRMIVRTTT